MVEPLLINKKPHVVSPCNIHAKRQLLKYKPQQIIAFMQLFVETCIECMV